MDSSGLQTEINPPVIFFEEIPCAVFLRGDRGWLYCNSEADKLLAILGISAEADLWAAIEAQIDPDLRLNFRATRFQSRYRFQPCQIYDAAGKQYWFELWGRQTSESWQIDGQQVREMVFGRNVTNKVQGEQRLKAQQQRLIDSEKMATLGLLVTGIAHEVNNPNHAIRLNAATLAGVWESLLPVLDRHFGADSDFLLGGMEYAQLRLELPMMLAGIRKASTSIEMIVNSLKNYVRTESEVLDDEINFNVVVKSAVTLMSAVIRQSTENFSLELGEDLPTISGHFQRLEQVLINLLQNACQALENKHQAIGVKTSFVPEQMMVELRLTDQGCGMSAEEIAHIVDPFYTTKRDRGGIGLGMAISRTIIDSHGGTLSYQSSPGQGTTAILRLPASWHTPVEQS